MFFSLLGAILQRHWGLTPGDAHDRVLAMTSQLIGMTVAAGVGGGAKDQEVAGWVAQQGTIYNELQHKEVEALIGEGKTCVANQNCRCDVGCPGQGCVRCGTNTLVVAPPAPARASRNAKKRPARHLQRA